MINTDVVATIANIVKPAALPSSSSVNTMTINNHDIIVPSSPVNIAYVNATTNHGNNDDTDIPELEEINLEDIYKTGSKRKLDEGNVIHSVKKQKTKCTEQNDDEAIILDPLGFAWHMNSCAYDAVLSILHAIWFHEVTENSFCASLTGQNDLMTSLTEDFMLAHVGSMGLTDCRDNLRRTLNVLSPALFPWGEFSGVHDLLHQTMETTNDTFVTSYHCVHNHANHGQSEVWSTGCMLTKNRGGKTSMQEWANDLRESTRHRCATCGTHLYMVKNMHYPLPMLAFSFPDSNVTIDETFSIQCNEAAVTYILRGIIYYGNYHFTSRIINDQGITWYHDGIRTASHTIQEGHISSLLDLQSKRKRKAVAALYTKN